MPIDPNSLPRDAETLRKIVVDLAEQLDHSLAEQNKYQSLLRELLEAQHNRKSEQLSKEQLALFEAAWQARSTEDESAAGEDDDDLDSDAGTGAAPKETPTQKRGGRQPLARHLKRERIVHDLAEAEKHCAGCARTVWKTLARSHQRRACANRYAWRWNTPTSTESCNEILSLQISWCPRRGGRGPTLPRVPMKKVK